MNFVDKFSFLGMRKDYWNFFAECLPKDEGIRYVNSLSQVTKLHVLLAALFASTFSIARVREKFDELILTLYIHVSITV